MNLQQLQTLGLSERWPKLTKHLQEVDSFEKHRQQAEARVGQLRAGLPAAHERDLDAEAQAARAGKGVPDAKHEPKLKGELEVAEREAVVMARAADGARADLGAFLAKHQGELYQDVVAARAQIASKVAVAAREALAGYGQWHGLGYTLKDLTPPPQPVENAPAQRLTQVIAGVQTTRSGGPDRGVIENALSYLMSLAENPVTGDEDAA